ncbi:MAG TPA: hypothetical protein VK576_02800 [Thermoleophilia bacterium]|nr:hypothetical protein [Thermoleophilia bacterium]
MPGKDTATNAVNAVTFNAQLARKLAQAQFRRRGVKRELRNAETQLAQVTLYLLEMGSVTHPELDEPARRTREAQDELNAVDEEIARLMAQFTTRPPAGEEQGAAEAEAAAPEAGAAEEQAAPAEAAEGDEPKAD